MAWARREPLYTSCCTHEFFIATTVESNGASFYLMVKFIVDRTNGLF